MNNNDRIDTLISDLEKNGGSREASDEYLVLCCEWTLEKGLPFDGNHPILKDKTRDYLLSPSGEKFEFGKRCWSGAKYIPNPTCDAQDALASLPEGDIGLVLSSPYGANDLWVCSLNFSEGGFYYVKAKTPAAAICLANLRRKLAE